MFDTDLTTLDVDGAIAHAVAVRGLIQTGEARLLQTAAHFADLHGELAAGVGVAGRALPGTERLVQLGGSGTPEAAEFATAELGAALGMSDGAAAVLIGDALDLRHRLPRLWARIRAGEVPVWIGRKTAQATRRYSESIAAAVDARVTPWAGRLSWGRLEPIILAAIAEADPELAREEAEDAATQLGVFRGRSSDHGIITTVLRNEAPDAIGFDAAVDRVADGLALLGDDRPKDVRRAAAVGVLANPQHTLVLFDRVAAAAAADPVRAARAADDGARTDFDSPATPADPLLDCPGPESPCPGPESPCPTCSSTGARRPHGQTDPRPPTVLYLHLTDQALFARGGVARLEDVGPVLLGQVKAWLANSRVTVKPVLDLAGMAPVDSYEIPDRLREAAHLRTPADIFPHGTSTSRRQDVDHSEPWVPPDEGGPPGQTHLDNLGKLTRRHHRIKTHSAWRVKQPFPGVWIWRSPHGRLYLVDHTGTTALGATALGNTALGNTALGNTALGDAA